MEDHTLPSGLGDLFTRRLAWSFSCLREGVAPKKDVEGKKMEKERGKRFRKGHHRRSRVVCSRVWVSLPSSQPAVCLVHGRSVPNWWCSQKRQKKNTTAKHKNTTTKAQKHHHTTTPPQTHHHKNAKTPPQKHKNTTTPHKNTKTSPQKHKNTTRKTQKHHHTPTCLYNTAPRHFFTTFLQHLSATLLPNTCLQH